MVLKGVMVLKRVLRVVGFLRLLSLRGDLVMRLVERNLLKKQSYIINVH
jgi:hypothetical protein